MKKSLLLITLVLFGCGISEPESQTKHFEKGSGKKDLTIQNKIVDSKQDILASNCLKVNSDNLLKTVVTTNFEQLIGKGKNVLWCATAQIAWNELCELIGEDVHMQNENHMVPILNKKVVTKEFLDKNTYIATAGTVESGVLEKIETQLKSKGESIEDYLDLGKPIDLISFSYLSIDLPFKSPFNSPKEYLNFKGDKVIFFGIKQLAKRDAQEMEAAEQVLVYDFQSNDDFILELKTDNKEHRLFLAKIPPKETLKTTIQIVKDRVKNSKPESMEPPSNLGIPKINFDIFHDYDELIGRKLNVNNDRFSGLPLDVFIQEINFNLDEKGASLVSYSNIVYSSRGRRDFIFNKPFLIMIQYKDSEWPYFALWVDNSELLVPFQEKQ